MGSSVHRVATHLGKDMNNFTINRSSWHYKLNVKLFSAYAPLWEADHPSFCSYWTSTVLKLILVIAMGSTLTLLIGSCAVAAYINPSLALKVVVTVIGCVGFIATVVLLYNQDSLVLQKYRAYKSKICPGVNYE